ncbi:MAG: hypothetical protein N5P05_003046 [Chroococcopsis gigantea SAG 12.99]|jgi:cyanoexosortase B-associated protein|nr:cyanoexosortase B system-associated protein [Chlorogloea purpurea SAG 13.99]MDV3001440.1 hypothetical protein [Chroococcopsis gigantea SAG 12.99]
MTNLQGGLWKTLRRLPLNYTILLILLFCLSVGSVVPQLLTGKFSWGDVPKIANLGANMTNIRENGINLPGWNSQQQKVLNLGEGKWSLQLLEQSGEPPTILLLLPQTYHRSHPGVEWSDLRSVFHWNSDPVTTLNFPTTGGHEVTARFFRGWDKRTFAVVQWYAFPDGGHYSPSRWYWSDQWAQLRGGRVPWVAVCLQVMIEPTKSLEDVRPDVLKKAQLVQNSLKEQFFNRLEFRSSP